MPEIKCLPPDHPDRIWLYCPTYSAAIAFTVLYGLATLAHIFQAICYRKPFAVVLIMGAVWETLGYVFRTLSILHQDATGYYVIQQFLIILSPLWINAFVYMLLARMIHFYLPPKHDVVFRLRARRIALIFVLFDIAAFLVQMVGGTIINPEFDPDINDIGVKVYMGGVGMQLIFISLFIGIAIQFQRMVSKPTLHYVLANSIGDNGPDRYEEQYRHFRPHKKPAALRLLYTVYFVLFLIIFRNIYRLVEFSSGAESHITSKEFYTFVFDSVPMLLAILAFNVYNPGAALKGERSDFSEENRELKRLKREKKMEAKQAKVMRTG